MSTKKTAAKANLRKKNPINKLVRARDTISANLAKISEAVKAQEMKLRSLSIDDTASREKVHGGLMLLLLIVKKYSSPPYPGCLVDYLSTWMWRPDSDIRSLVSRAIKDGLVEYADADKKYLRLTSGDIGSYSGEWYYNQMDMKRVEGEVGAKR